MNKSTSITTGSAGVPARNPRCVAKRWMRLISLSFIIFHLSFSRVAAQLSAEYWIDSDPGMGLALPLSMQAADADGIAEAVSAIPVSGLSVGIHQLGFRAISVSDGVSHYGPTLTMPFTIPSPVVHDAAFSSIEYFWDEDPGMGLATPLATTTQDDSGAEVLGSISTEGLSIGDHLLGFRAISVSGGVAHYGPTIVQSVTIPDVVVHDAAFSSIEYFWDEDPGMGLATPLATTTQDDSGAEVLSTIPTEGLSTGDHLLGIRAISMSNGLAHYGPTIVQSVTIRPPKDDPAGLLIALGEYFWNDDPGYGHGTPIAFTPGQELTLDDLQIPSGSVHGDAMLFIRFRGTEGWSPTMSSLVMVDAEGNYTLNAQAETSLEARNYQTLSDALGDFADCGVGNDITLTVPTTGTDYALTVGTDSAVQVLQTITAQMTATSTVGGDLQSPRHQKTIAFTAAEGSGNSITVTVPYAATAWQPYAAAVSFFALTSQEHVALTINGTAYDFTPASQRMAEVCSGEATAPVALSAISTALTASWKAQPHAATVLSGFPAEGTGDLPAMTIENSGTQTDSLAYAVTLTDADGHALCTYTYYIYVHARVSNQQFASLSPADGASLDPGTVTLSWSTIGDAVGGYRVAVTDITEGTESVLDGFPVETAATALTVTAQSGHRYAWTVTAIGYCDELVSPVMTFEGRLLPDLAVTAISLPEAAQAGNSLTVTATIGNQGEGATTEGSWTDRLYYVIDSQDFAQAVMAAEAKHTGNLAVGDSYTATFQMQVPYEDAGNLRVFVVTDADGKVMETADDNNRTLSATAATLSPFYMDKGDLAALRQLYNALGGESWNGTRWDATSELVKSGNWSGVTFDTDGHVTAISLQARGLSGSLSAFAATSWQLPRLQTLNLSRNALTGDPAAMITAEGLPALTSLDLSYNQIDSLSAPLPATITTLSLAAQHRQYGSNTTYPGHDSMTALTLDIGKSMTVSLPPIMAYDHAKQTFSQHPQLNVWTPDLKTRHGRLTWDNLYERYAYTANSWKQTAQQDEEAVLVVTDSYTLATSALPARLHLTPGDANLTGFVDVNDVQRTLNYVINTNNTTTFSFWAANTYTAEESELLINIQDIVSTVNIVLENQEGAGARRALALDADDAAEATDAMTDAEGIVTVEGSYVMLDASTEIAALCIELRGVRSDEVRLLLDRHDWQMMARNTGDGVRLMLFSPTGQSLPVCSGQQLLRLAAQAEPLSVQASSPEAESVAIAIGDIATGIAEAPEVPEATETLYDLQGRKLQNAHQRKGLYIKNGHKQIIK